LFARQDLAREDGAAAFCQAWSARGVARTGRHGARRCREVVSLTRTRASDALRPVDIRLGVLVHPLASAEIRVGRTRVLCAVTVEDKVPPHRRGTGLGWVTAEYGLLPAATHVRTVRESVRGRPSGRSQEISRLIGRCLRSVTDLAALGERTLTVDCDVLDADGGTRMAAVTGASAALAAAAQRLWAEGTTQTNVLRQQVAGVSVGVVGGERLLDLDYEEDSAAEVDLNVVFSRSGELVEVQGTGEGRPFTRAELEELLELAARGAGILFQAQEAALREGGG
jgi:ribonuclease PH